MSIFDVASIAFLGAIVIIIIGVIVLEHKTKKYEKEAVGLLKDFESIRKLKKTNPDDFLDKCFKIISVYKHGYWHAFRVKRSKHDKGWFVEGEYFNEKRFWPSGDTLGCRYYPNSYLSKDDAEKELLNVLERLVDFIIRWETLGREFDERRED